MKTKKTFEALRAVVEARLARQVPAAVEAVESPLQAFLESNVAERREREAQERYELVLQLIRGTP